MEPGAHERHCASPGPVHDVQLAKQETHVDMLDCQKVEAGHVLLQRPAAGLSTGNAGEHERHCPDGKHVAQSAGHGKHRLSEVDA